jgi:heme oxygenase
MLALLSGTVTSEAYTDYLTQLAPIYEALESWDDKKTPWAIFDRRLDRFESIVYDIESLGGSYLVYNETLSYVSHIKKLIKEEDWIRLLAHHYTRYLGDLSGGQAVATLVIKNLMIPPNFLSFYEFQLINNKVRYKETYKEQLDQLKLTEQEQAIFIEEVITSFKFNQAMFSALGDRWLSDPKDS